MDTQLFFDDLSHDQKLQVFTKFPLEKSTELYMYNIVAGTVAGRRELTGTEAIEYMRKFCIIE